MLKSRMFGRMRGPLVVATSGAVLAIAAAGPVPPLPEARLVEEPPAAVSQSPRVALAEAAKLLAAGPARLEEATAFLKELGGRELAVGEREDWLRLAREAALRGGDLAMLESLRDAPDRFALVMIQQVLLAKASLAAADFPAVRALLAQVGDPEALNEREKRRCYSILARMAQLEGKPDEEREYVDKLVDHLQHWSRPMCQSCHATLNEPDKLTHLKVSEVWFGDRFVELMRRRGDADAIRAESEARLAKRPKDERARIRLAFALRALGREEAAMEQFRTIPWAAFPDQPGHPPRMMTTFP